LKKKTVPQRSLAERLIHPPVNRAAYSDRTAWILACCSHLAYDDIKKLPAQLAQFGMKLKQKFYCDLNENFAYLAVHPTYAVLAFKGTVPSESQTVKTDLDFKMVRARYGEFHQGFIDTYHKMAPAIEKALAQLDVPIYVTGHSLGGALSLVATTFIKDQDHLAACYTYGCPKVGNSQFANHLFKVPVYRCVHHADIVPAVPFYTMGFRDYGDMRYLTNDNKVCEGSQAFFRRGLAMCWPFNWLDCIQDHGIKHYMDILHEFAEERNR
jgi:triacylglycerol lipase